MKKYKYLLLLILCIEFMGCANTRLEKRIIKLEHQMQLIGHQISVTEPILLPNQLK